MTKQTPKAPKILLLDIETAPHRVFAWGLWGQDIHLDQIEEPGYTLCWAAKWLGPGRKMMFNSVQGMFNSVQGRGRKGMLRGIYSLIT